MAAMEQAIHARALLVKISVITGWVIPDNDLQDVLVDQFQRLLTEKYSTCNVDEIEYAFRANGTTVKDWGKQVNLALIDEVMIPYMNQRGEISRHEEAYNLAKLQYKPKEDISDEGMSKWLDELKGQRMPVIFLPLQLYVWLIKTGRLKPTIRQKWEYMEKAVAYQQGKLIQACDEVMNQENRQALSEFNRMKAAGEFEGAVADQLRNLAKKMILFDYLYATP